MHTFHSSVLFLLEGLNEYGGRHETEAAAWKGAESTDKLSNDMT